MEVVDNDNKLHMIGFVKLKSGSVVVGVNCAGQPGAAGHKRAGVYYHQPVARNGHGPKGLDHCSSDSW